MSDFLDAVRSAMKLADGLTIVASVLTVAGINFVFGEVPAIATVVLCVVFYVTGFLVACHRKMEKSRSGQSCSSQAPLITLDDVHAAEDRARAPLEVELAKEREKTARLQKRVDSLEALVDELERPARERFSADATADAEESGVDGVGQAPTDACGEYEKMADGTWERWGF